MNLEDRSKPLDKASRRKLAGNPWWAAFMAGQMINQLNWLLTQVILVGSRDMYQEITLMINRLVPLFLVVTPPDDSDRRKASLIKLATEWTEVTTSEQFAESQNETIKRYWSRAKGEDVEDDFTDEVEYSRGFAKRASDLIFEVMVGRDDLKFCFLLGKTVDQGIHPPITGLAVYRLGLNSKFFLNRRSCKHRKALARYRVDRARYHMDMEVFRLEWAKCREAMGPASRIDDDDEASDDLDWEVDRLMAEKLPSQPVRPKLPKRRVLIWRRLSKGDIPHTPIWRDEVQSLWGKVSMPLELPPAFFALDSRHGKQAVIGVVGAIERRTQAACIRMEALRRDLVSPGSGSRLESVRGMMRRLESAHLDWAGATDDPQEEAARIVPSPENQHVGDSTVGDASSKTFEPINPRISASEEFARLRQFKTKVDPEGRYIGDSLPMLRVYEKIIELNKQSSLPVLIVGKTGVGKTEIAELIHQASDRSKMPFRREQASIAKIHDFGIVLGKWLGYGEQAPLNNIPKGGSSGLLRDCAGGTVFLDEVADATHDFQTFLLDVLDNKLMSPPSGKHPGFRPDVRIISATNVDLRLAVDEGRFRRDLMSRIKSRMIYIPPLSDRKEDITAFLRSKCGEHNFDDRFVAALFRHSWPDNVRELLGVLQAATDRTNRKDDKLTLDHLTLEDPSIVPAVRAMNNQDAQVEVTRQFVRMLEARGLILGV